MQRLLFILVLMLAPAAIFAAELQPFELEYEGHAGFWFPDESATRMLKDLKELPPLRLKVDKLELKIEKFEDYTLLLKRDIEITEKISDKWETAFDEQVAVTEAQQDYYESEIESLRKWYRSPMLWFGVGFACASALAVGLNFGLAETR